MNEAAWLLARTATYALVIYWLVSFIRALPKIEGKFLTGKKPWGCNLCMTTWCGLWLGLIIALPDGFNAWQFAGGWRAGAAWTPLHAAWQAMTPHALPVFAATGLALGLTRWKADAPDPGVAALENFLVRR